MVEAASLRVPPTLFQEINFISNIYTTRQKLLENLEDNGYRLHQDVDIWTVKCFLYTPKAFPRTREEAAKFDFSKYRGRCLTLGVCIGGTTMRDGWDEKAVLALQGVFKLEDNERPTADKSASKIFEALDKFTADFPELSLHNITLEVHICGYSLGGLFGQVAIIFLQDWAETTKSKIQLRTYESCGLPTFYYGQAQDYTVGDPEYWKRRVENYKSFPNPLNSVFADLGRVFHLMNLDSLVSDRMWAWKCFLGSAKRVSATAHAGLAFLSNMTDRTSTKIPNEQSLKAVAACTAAEFGLELYELNKTHNINLMRTCFDDNGNMHQDVCREMKRWTIYGDFNQLVANLVEDAAHGFVLFDKRNAGLHTLTHSGGKKGFIERKLESFPGYQPLNK